MSDIRVIMDIPEPEKVNVRLTMIMPLGDWIKIQTELKPDDGRILDHWHPAKQMERTIDDAVRKVKQDVFGYDNEPVPVQGTAVSKDTA